MLASHPNQKPLQSWTHRWASGSLSIPKTNRGERAHEAVLPYLGGGFVRSPARRYRVLGRPAPGWYRFWLRGAEALALGEAPPEGLDGLPQARGFLVGSWFFGASGRAVELHLLPREQCHDLSPCLARRVAGGLLIFESLDLRTAPEDEALEALDDGLPCPSSSPSLRVAYGFAMLARLCRRLGIPASPWGLRDQLELVATGGKQRAYDLLSPCVSMAPLHDFLGITPGAAGADEGLVAPILEASGATLLEARGLGDDLLEVRFRFLDRAFGCVVERASLRVIDAGLCVDGSDGKLTLACLPSVLREALAAGKLIYTFRALSLPTRTGTGRGRRPKRRAAPTTSGTRYRTPQELIPLIQCIFRGDFSLVVQVGALGAWVALPQAEACGKACTQRHAARAAHAQSFAAWNSASRSVNCACTFVGEGTHEGASGAPREERTTRRDSPSIRAPPAHGGAPSVSALHQRSPAFPRRERWCMRRAPMFRRRERWCMRRAPMFRRRERWCMRRAPDVSAP